MCRLVISKCRKSDGARTSHGPPLLLIFYFLIHIAIILSLYQLNIFYSSFSLIKLKLFYSTTFIFISSGPRGVIEVSRIVLKEAGHFMPHRSSLSKSF